MRVSSRPWMTSIGTSQRGEPRRCGRPTGIDGGELASGPFGVEPTVVLGGRQLEQPFGSRYFFDAQILEFSDAAM